MSVISTLEVMIGANIAGLTSGLQQADRSLQGFASSAGQRLQGIGDSMMQLGGSMSLIMAPIVALGVQGVRAASQFETKLAEISARTGTVGDALERVRNFALELGQSSPFSATEALDGFLQLLSSGQSVEEAFGTLPIVLDAAAASGENLGMVADGVTDIMAAFNLSIDDARGLVDSLAAAAGASSADMAGLFQGFANVGGVARSFGLSVEQTAAILAIFSENGIKGAEAGTQLRSMLNNMSRDTDSVNAALRMFNTSLFDTNGAMRPLGEVISDITESMAGMTDQQRIQAVQDLAGTYGQLGLQALASSISMDEMIARMNGQASAADVAAARMNTFAGRLETLGGAVESLNVRVFTPFMNNVLAPIVGMITNVINRVIEWSVANPELTQTILTITAAVAGAGAAITALGAAIKIVGVLMTAVSGPVGILIAAVGALFAAFSTNFLGIRDTVENILPALDSALQLIAFHIQYYLGEIWEAVRPGLEELRNWFLNDALPAIVNFVNNTALPAIRDFIDVLEGIWTVVSTSLGNVYNWFVNDAMPAIAAIVEDHVMPAIRDFVSLLKIIWQTVRPYLEPIIEWFRDQFQYIGENYIRPVINFVNDLITRIQQSIEWLRRLGGGTPQINLPGEIRPGVMMPTTGYQPGLLAPGSRTTVPVVPAVGGFGTNQAISPVQQAFSNYGAQFFSGVRSQVGLHTGTPLPPPPGGYLPYSGPRATGGPVFAGMSYLVGERGPEVVTMGMGGHVTPNNQLGGNVTININGNAQYTEAQYRQMFLQALYQYHMAEG